MHYCDNCHLVCEGPVCPYCGKAHLRAPENSDYCYLATMVSPWGEAMQELLTDAQIPGLTGRPEAFCILWRLARRTRSSSFLCRLRISSRRRACKKPSDKRTTEQDIPENPPITAIAPQPGHGLRRDFQLGGIALEKVCGSVGEERRREIAVAGVGQQNDDGFALVLRTLGKLNGGPDGSAGGNADENALAAAKLLAGFECVVVVDGDDLVVDLRVEHLRDKARADALNFCEGPQRRWTGPPRSWAPRPQPSRSGSWISGTCPYR